MTASGIHSGVRGKPRFPSFLGSMSVVTELNHGLTGVSPSLLLGRKRMHLHG